MNTEQKIYFTFALLLKCSETINKLMLIGVHILFLLKNHKIYIVTE